MIYNMIVLDERKSKKKKNKVGILKMLYEFSHVDTTTGNLVFFPAWEEEEHTRPLLRMGESAMDDCSPFANVIYRYWSNDRVELINPSLENLKLLEFLYAHKYDVDCGYSFENYYHFINGRYHSLKERDYKYYYDIVSGVKYAQFVKDFNHAKKICSQNI